MYEAFTLMFKEFSTNKGANINIRTVNLTTIDGINDADYVDFNRGMGWATLCLKFGILQGYETLQGALQGAYDEHVKLKTKSLQRQYAALAKRLIPLQSSYGKINDLYPDMPEDIEVLDVKAIDLEGLKEVVPEFKESVEAYKEGLTAAKKWHSSFMALHKKHTGYVKELETINANFATLRTANGDNPEIPEEDLEDFDSLDDIGELEDIQTVLDTIAIQMKDHRVLLAKARKWKPKGAPGVVEEAQEETVEEKEGAAATTEAEAQKDKKSPEGSEEI